MAGPKRGPHGDRESDFLRFQMMELAANLLALLSILGTMLVVVLAADAGPVVIGAIATAISVAFRAWLAYRHRHARPTVRPERPDMEGGPGGVPAPRSSMDEPMDTMAGEENP